MKRMQTSPAVVRAAALAAALGAGVAGALPAAAAAPFDVNGVTLGGTERGVKEVFPSAHCRPLEWKSKVAQRRCDDSRAVFIGLRARVTFYLMADSVQAFDVLFNTQDTASVTAKLEARFGKPSRVIDEKVGRPDRLRRIVTLRWDRGEDHALYVSQPGKKRSQFSAWRGRFRDEIYRVR